MMAANYRGLRYGDRDALLLAERWSKVAAMLFAVGAMSGTVVSFEMGLLAGADGHVRRGLRDPFASKASTSSSRPSSSPSMAGTGCRPGRTSGPVCRWSGLPVALGGALGTASLVAATGWMNIPGGITLKDGRLVDVQPLAVFFNRAFWYEFVHMLLAAHVVAGFLWAGVYAAAPLRGRRDH
jgi:cytochrome d ubiquinol oxidase subunit I